jgi:hypothetical protein
VSGAVKTHALLTGRAPDKYLEVSNTYSIAVVDHPGRGPLQNAPGASSPNHASTENAQPQHNSQITVLSHAYSAHSAGGHATSDVGVNER